MTTAIYSTRRALMVLAGICACGGQPVAPQKPQPGPSSDLEARGKELAKKLLIVDGHIDVPYRLYGGRDENGKLTEDVTGATEEGDFDEPRSRAGGLNVPFMSIYVPAELQKVGGAKKLADDLIDMVENIAVSAPDKFAMGKSIADIKNNTEAGKISLALGIENGAAIEESLENVKHFYDRGVRYITLTHSKNNQICDSSYDEERTWKGLSPFGRKVIAEMNRVGIMVDISHVSDDAFYQAIEVSQVPVIASHSSARHFTPGFERNMDDDMIKALAADGGVLMINFGSTFLLAEARVASEKLYAAAEKFAKENNIDDRSDKRIRDFVKEYNTKTKPIFAKVDDVADHIDHVVKLVGVDHVGLGSDFDGVGDSLPEGSRMFPITRTYFGSYSPVAIPKKIWRKSPAPTWSAFGSKLRTSPHNLAASPEHPAQKPLSVSPPSRYKSLSARCKPIHH